MHIFHGRRLSYANITATLALVLSMSGGALAANHYLISSTKQISPKVIKKLRGKTGATGKTGPAGPAGPQGLAGSKGEPGQNGANFTAATTLQSGQTLTGSWGVGGTTGSWMSDDVQFRIPLAVNLPTENYIASSASYTSDCPGPGKAAAGQLCVYRDEGSGTSTFSAIYNDGGGTSKPGASTTGFLIYFKGESPTAYVSGDWAVTAP